jgi:hypothetical protein
MNLNKCSKQKMIVIKEKAKKPTPPQIGFLPVPLNLRFFNGSGFQKSH